MMKAFKLFGILFVVIVLFATSSVAVNQLQLNGGNFNVSWNYLSATTEIEFEVRAKTTGYVALGLTKTNSDMKGLDLFVGGVNSGNKYLKDYSVNAMQKPDEDSQQDYTLINASESDGITMVHCKRRLDTQDSNDLQIQPGDKMYFAWAISTSSDSLTYHSNNRGYSALFELVPVPQTTTASPTTAPPTTAPSTYDREISFHGGNYYVFWKYNSSTNELFFKLTVKATGYVSLGFSDTNSGMSNMDIVVAGVSGGQGYIGDYKSVGTGAPPKDSSQDYILLQSAKESEGTTTVEFKRKINTEDDKDQQIVPGTSYYIGWAYHSSSDSLVHHSQRGYSQQKVIIIQAIPSPSPSQTSSPTTSSVAPQPSSSPTTSSVAPQPTSSPTTSIVAPQPSSSPTPIVDPPPTSSPTTSTVAPQPSSTIATSAKTSTFTTTLGIVTTASSTIGVSTTTVSPTTTPRTNTYDREISFHGGNYYVFWKYDSSTNELFFKLTVKATGYVSLGFSDTNSGMSNMDIVVAGVSGGQGYIGDYNSTGTGPPPRDSSQDYTLLSAQENASMTIVEFKRKIDTGDDKDLQIKPGTSYYIGWAYHSSSDSLVHHSQRGYSPQKVVLVAGNDTHNATTPTTTTPTPTSTQKPKPTTTAAMTTCSVVLLFLGIFAAFGVQ